MMDSSRTFCVLPWMHLASNSSGNLRLCCNSTPGKNLILDENMKPFRLDQSLKSVSQIYNVPWMKEIRKKMLAGDKVDICERCYTEEEAGVRSMRQGWNDKYTHLAESLVASTQPDGAADFKPMYVDLRLGNLCNLKCRMCNPYASKKWLEDWNKIDSFDSLPEAEKNRLASMDWFKNDRFVENLLPVLRSVEEIYFTGGEPLLITKHFELLEALISEGTAASVTLKYNTNLTYIPEKVFALWGHFKKVFVNTSIDGVGAINDYIRHPSQWSEISKNLERMDEFCRATPHVHGSVHTTVQLYNLEHLIPLFDHMKSLKGFQKFPYLNILNHPTCLNIRNAPRSLKKAVSVEVWQWQQAHAHQMAGEHQFKKLQGVLDYLNGKDLLQQAEFLKYSKEIDVLRGESLQAVAPRLWEAIVNMANESTFTLAEPTLK